MNAILVMEMPESCSKCPCSDGVVGECWARDKKDAENDTDEFDPYLGEPGRCPLKPMPERKHNACRHGFAEGWNACIGAIERSKG